MVARPSSDGPSCPGPASGQRKRAPGVPALFSKFSVEGLLLFQAPLVVFLVHERVLVAERAEALVEEVDDLLLERVLVVVVEDLLLVGEHLAEGRVRRQVLLGQLLLEGVG